MAQPQKTSVRAATASRASVSVTRGPLTDKFLMKVARHELACDELVQLGVFLELSCSAVQEIIRDSKGTVTSTFVILESWRNNTKAVSSGDMYEQVCGAYMELKKTGAAEYIRSEQVLYLKDQLQKAQETSQTWKQISNEQMRLVKDELQEVKEELQKINGVKNMYFEPVVSLPKVTDLRTGEEDCDVLFCQRAKLYRFTDKQWKERGIGEMKLLRNRKTGCVRVLLRSEQVLKVACNHNLTADITLQPLLTSETAWCWSALDYVDGEGQHEQFAVKFKTKELATRFKDVFEQCQRQLTDYPGEDVVRSTDSEDTHLKELTVVDSGTVVADNEPPADTLSNTLTSSGSGANVNSGEQALTSPRDDYDDDDDDDDDSSQEQLEQVFWKRATMYYIEDGHAVSRGQGELSVVVDEDVVGLRVCMKTDAGHLVCSHVICCGYSITKTSKNCCEWAGQDFSTDEPIPRHFRVQLSSTDALDEFMYCFQQGVLRAQESQLYETMPEMVPISPGNNSTARTQ